MKPFNLQAALNGAPVVTVSGEPVTGLHWFEGVTDGYALFGIVNGEVESWSDAGGYHYQERPCGLDLRMAEDDQS